MTYLEPLKKCSKTWLFEPLQNRKALFNSLGDLCFWNGFKIQPLIKKYFQPVYNPGKKWLVDSLRQPILSKVTYQFKKILSLCLKAVMKLLCQNQHMLGLLWRRWLRSQKNINIIGEFLSLDFGLWLRGVLRINYHKLW